MESKNAEGIRNLLLKIVFPLAFPLAGAFISDLIANRANRHSYTDSSDNSLQLNQSYGSICQGEVEEEEEEMDSAQRARRKMARSENTRSTAGTLVVSDFTRQASNAEEIMVVEATESSSEAQANKQLQDDQRILADDEIVSLKLMVSALEERASGIEAQFHEYCDMKEQESEYQKMQIMCLGMKLELLESQNQRLEAAAVEIRAAAEEFAAMRGKLERLQNKVRMISRRSKQESDAVGERIMSLDAKQALMARRCEEFERCMEEMKQLTLQLQQQRGAANSENVEVAVERSLRNLSSGRDLVDGLEALRDRWAAGMEEMIYLGWITAWLQHDLMFCDEEEEEEEHGDAGAALGGSTPYHDEEDEVRDAGHPPEEAEGEKKKGETMVAAAAPSNEVELCKAASVSSSGSGPPRRSVELERPRSSCMGFAAAGPCSRDGARGGGWSIGRPRLLRKLRGWAAGGKGGTGKRPCRVLGPCCQK